MTYLRSTYHVCLFFVRIPGAGEADKERLEGASGVPYSTLKSPTRSRRPEGASSVSEMTFLPSLHRQISLVAVILFPHSTSPGLSSMSISYPPLPGTTDSTAKTFSSHPSTRPPTSSTSFQRRERSYLRLGDYVWSYRASYELLTECMLRTCSEQVSP